MRLSSEREVLGRRIQRARISRRGEGAGERAARKSVLADLESQAVRVDAELEALVGGDA